MKNLIENKFLLPTISILVGAGMVPFDLVSGAQWTGLTTTLVMGYFGVTGWQRHRESLEHVEQTKLLQHELNEITTQTHTAQEGNT